MTRQPPPATSRYIGEAERTLRALLQTQLDQAGLSFPEWTTFVTLDVAGPLGRAELVKRQVTGQIAATADADAAIERLVTAGLLVTEPRLARTDAGDALYQPLRQRVNEISHLVYDGLSAGDLETTQRTLEEIAQRARKVLDEAA